MWLMIICVKFLDRPYIIRWQLKQTTVFSVYTQEGHDGDTIWIEDLISKVNEYQG